MEVVEQALVVVCDELLASLILLLGVRTVAVWTGGSIVVSSVSVSIALETE
jgi:hypothetical protein